jgi:hypothetical protein
VPDFAVFAGHSFFAQRIFRDFLSICTPIFGSGLVPFLLKQPDQKVGLSFSYLFIGNKFLTF